jgi:hypothetical protein
MTLNFILNAQLKGFMQTSNIIGLPLDSSLWLKNMVQKIIVLFHGKWYKNHTFFISLIELCPVFQIQGSGSLGHCEQHDKSPLPSLNLRDLEWCLEGLGALEGKWRSHPISGEFLTFRETRPVGQVHLRYTVVSSPPPYFWGECLQLIQAFHLEGILLCAEGQRGCIEAPFAWRSLFAGENVCVAKG